MAAQDYIIDLKDISIDPGPYMGGDSLAGDITVVFRHDNEIDVYSKVEFKVQLWTAINVFVGEKYIRHADFKILECPGGKCGPIDISYPWDYDNTPIDDLPDDFYIKIVKVYTTTVFDQTADFEIGRVLSDQKKMLTVAFLAAYNPELVVDSFAVYKELNDVFIATVPSGTDVTALNPFITISAFSTVVPESFAENDFTSDATYRVTAEDGSYKDYLIRVIFAPPADLFIYDNEFTRIIPEKAEINDTIEYYVFISNSGLVPSQGNEVLTVTLHDSQDNYLFVIAETVIDVVNPFIDVLINGSFVIPENKEYTLDGDQNSTSTILVIETIDVSMVKQTGTITIDGDTFNYISYSGSTFTLDAPTGRPLLDGLTVYVHSAVPLGSDIDYMLSFHLNNSLVDRHFIISAWSVSSKTMKWNKAILAFIGEATTTAKMYALINQDFFALHPDDDQFYYYSDNILDGNIMFFGQEFEPYIEFYINKFAFEKVYDNLVVSAGSIGLKKIEYWTDLQNQVHIWPEAYVDPLTRPWIDPEFREGKWYFPVHLEEKDENLDMADVSRLRGSFLRVRFTFKPLYRNFLKEVISHFKISKT